MSKKPSILIIVLVVIYLAGLFYLSRKQPKPTTLEQETSTSGQVAPDGTVLKGPTSPPIADRPIDKNTSPLQQSTGPSYPPPN